MTTLPGSRFQQYANEIEDVIDFEEDEIKKGRFENVTLLEGIASNISIDQFLKVAVFRGKHWRFLSALSDKSLQLQGYALLHFMADALGNDLALQVYHKARFSMRRLKRIKADMDDRYGQDEWSEQLFAETMDDLVEMPRDTRHHYWDRSGRMLG